MTELHPIGTVVRLKRDTELLFMIIGFLPKKAQGKVFDYVAVPYPLGLIELHQYVCFNSDAIKTVEFDGYKDSSCDLFLNSINEFSESVKSELSALQSEKN